MAQTTSTLPRFEIDLADAQRKGDPAVVSWRKLVAGSHVGDWKSLSRRRKGAGGAAAAAALAAAGGGTEADKAVAALEARLGGGQPDEAAFEKNALGGDACEEEAGGSEKPKTKYSMLGVIAKYEAMYTAGIHGQNSQDSDRAEGDENGGGDNGASGGAEGGKDALPDGKLGNSNDSFYDTEDSFIDDEELYEEMDMVAGDAVVDTKYGGFYVNAGALETTVNHEAVAKVTAAATAAEKKTKGKRKKAEGAGGAAKKKKTATGAAGTAGTAGAAGAAGGVGGPTTFRQIGSPSTASQMAPPPSEDKGPACEALCDAMNVKLPPKPRLPAAGVLSLAEVLPLLEAATAAELARRAALPEGDGKRVKLGRAVSDLLADAGAIGAKRKLKEGKIDEGELLATLAAVQKVVDPLAIAPVAGSGGIKKHLATTVNAVRARRRALDAASKQVVGQLRLKVDAVLGDTGARARAAADAATSAERVSTGGESDFQQSAGDGSNGPIPKHSASALSASRAVLVAAGVQKYDWDTEANRLLLDAIAFQEQRLLEEKEVDAHLKGIESGAGVQRLVVPDVFYDQLAAAFPPGLMEVPTLRKQLNRQKWTQKRAREAEAKKALSQGAKA